MNKNQYFFKHFGLIVFAPTYILVILLSFFKINLVYNDCLVKILNNFYLYSESREIALFVNMIMTFILPLSYLFVTHKKYKNNRIKILIVYVMLIVLFQFFFSSFLIDLSDMENNYEANTDSGMIALVIYPFNLIALFIISAFYDFIKNKSVP